MSTGVVLSQFRHARHQSNLCRDGSCQSLIVQPPAITPNATSHTNPSTPVCINQPLRRHSRCAPSFRVFICGVHWGLKHQNIPLQVQGSGRDAHSRPQVDGLARQVWYSLRPSIVTACTRRRSASYTSTSHSHNVAHEERILKPGMTEAGDEPARTSYMEHLGHADVCTRHLMRHHSAPT